MLKFILALLLVTATGSAIAEFSCEQIQDEAVRTSCIEDHSRNNKPSKDDQYQKFIAEGKAIMTVNFKDPGSAQWRHLFISEITNGDLTTWFLCGQVNAKNSYGAYIGFKMFIVDEKDGNLEGEVIFNLISSKACSNPVYKDGW